MKKFLDIVTNCIFIVVLALGSVTTSFATLLDVTVDTTALTGQTGSLALDLINGGYASTNTSTISSFSTDGTLGTVASTSGDVTGILPAQVILDTASALFNELNQNITFGSQFSFTLNVTGNGPSIGNTPDAFSLFLLDSSGNPIPNTNDPTGSNALFLFNIDGTSSGQLNIYTSTDSIPTVNWAAFSPSTPPAPNGNSIPEPAVIWLLAFGFIGMCWTKLKTISEI